MRIIAVFLFISFYFYSAAQNKKDSVSVKSDAPVMMCDVKLADGTFFAGQVESENDSLLVLKTKNKGAVTLQKQKIVSSNYYFKKSKEFHQGFSIENHIANNYHVLSGNALLFSKKAFEGSSIWFVGYNFNFVFNKNFSLGISNSIALFPVFIHAKANFQIASLVHFGFEAYTGIPTPSNAQQIIGIGAIKLTIGDAKKNITGILSTGADLTAIGTGNIYIYGLAGSAVIDENLRFVGELWASKSVSTYLALAGLRTTMRPRISWVFGAGCILGSGLKTYLKAGTLPLWPYVGFSFRV
ncbi:MAG TPA: hypothetical protein VNZ49_11075 [Bacteroidia bacterium]|jgi:hypothetical protein|nr:hypothetical protein [Bacteroidia bacterium]